MSDVRRQSHVQSLATRSPVAKLSSKLGPELWYTAYASGSATSSAYKKSAQEQAYSSDGATAASLGEDSDESLDESDGYASEPEVDDESEAELGEDTQTDAVGHRSAEHSDNGVDDLRGDEGAGATAREHRAAIETDAAFQRLIDSGNTREQAMEMMVAALTRQTNNLAPEVAAGMIRARRRYMAELRRDNMYGPYYEDDYSGQTTIERPDASVTLRNLVQYLASRAGEGLDIPSELGDQIFSTTGSRLPVNPINTQPQAMSLSLDTGFTGASTVAEAANQAVTITSTTAISTSSLAVGATGGAIGSAIALFAKLFTEEDADPALVRGGDLNNLDQKRKSIIKELDTKSKTAAAKAAQAEHEMKAAESQFKKQLNILDEREARLHAREQKFRYASSQANIALPRSQYTPSWPTFESRRGLVACFQHLAPFDVDLVFWTDGTKTMCRTEVASAAGIPRTSNLNLLGEDGRRWTPDVLQRKVWELQRRQPLSRSERAGHLVPEVESQSSLLERAQAMAQQEIESLREQVKAADHTVNQLRQEVETSKAQCRTRDSVERVRDAFTDHATSSRHKLDTLSERHDALETEYQTMLQKRNRRIALHFVACVSYAKLKRTTQLMEAENKNLEQQIDAIRRDIRALPNVLEKCKSGHSGAAKVRQWSFRSTTSSPRSR